jgi:predicted ATPase
MLYITRLELQNIRRFAKLVIEFNDPGCSALLVGDNGDGKSTILRSLAMGLCDQASAGALLRELSGEFIRHNSRGPSFVQVDLANTSGARYRIHTRFVGLKAFERLEQTHFRARGKADFHKVPESRFPWSEIFVTGYGPGIRTFGNADYSYYLAVDAVYSLFRYDAALQSPELVIRRLVDEARWQSRQRGARTLARLRQALAKLVNLKNSKAIELSRRGVIMKGAWGREELAALGDGYRATTTWTLDLMSWWLLHDEEPAHGFSAANVAGIVIVDELEQHLHPRWQRTILPQLRKVFPKIQFVVATHSPLVASSSPDVTVHRLQKGKHSTHLPYGWRAEEVYEMMGVPTSRAPSFEDEVVREFTRLDEKGMRGDLSAGEKSRLNQLRAELNKLPPDDPTRVMIELAHMAKSLKKDI